MYPIEQFMRTFFTDMKAVKKALGIYAAVYMLCLPLIYYHSSTGADRNNISAAGFLNIISNLIHMVNAIYFQRAYTRQKTGLSYFSSISSVIFRTYTIAFLQLCIIVASVIVVLIIVPSSVLYHPLFSMIKLGGAFLLILILIPRLMFIQSILVYKHEQAKMHSIISESKQIFKQNTQIIIPIIVVLHMPFIYLSIINSGVQTKTQSILLSIMSFCLPLICSKLVIDYYIERAEKARQKTDITKSGE